MEKIFEKYIIEIGDELNSRYGDSALYRAKGFNSLVFDEHGLSKLKKLDGVIPLEEHERIVREVRKNSLETGYAHGYSKGQIDNDNRMWDMVYKTLMLCPLFRGIYDAENGSELYMNGIGTVMEYIADKAGRLKSFDTLFPSNIRASQKKKEMSNN